MHLILGCRENPRKVDSFWKEATKLANNFKHIDRGMVWQPTTLSKLAYVPVGELKKHSPRKLNMNQDFYEGLLAIISNGYNPDKEFILALDLAHPEGFEYIVAIAPLDEKNWNKFKRRFSIKQQAFNDTLILPRETRVQLTQKASDASRKENLFFSLLGVD